MHGPWEGRTNVSLHAHGTLSRDGDVALIEPTPGRVESFRVGEARLILLEGDLVEAEFEESQSTTLADGRAVEIPASVTADFGEVRISLDDVANG
jgi:hypothetical protein